MIKIPYPQLPSAGACPAPSLLVRGRFPAFSGARDVGTQRLDLVEARVSGVCLSQAEMKAKLLVVETPGPIAGPWLKPRGVSEPTTVPHQSTCAT